MEQEDIKTGSEVTLVLVKFDHFRVVTTAIALSQYHSQYPQAVPISRHEAASVLHWNKTKQLKQVGGSSLLCWHGPQLSTKCKDWQVVNVKNVAFDARQAYVAFSRVRTLQGLYIKNFKPANISQFQYCEVKWKDCPPKWTCAKSTRSA